MTETMTAQPGSGGPNDGERLLKINIEEEMQASYLDYAMSVIIGRALPDVRDGLKPVHRRVLFAMHELGNAYNRAYKKSARIVGDVIGKYHPHGDQAVYDTLVRMAQDFSMRHMLVDGQGNFGSVDGDPPAAMRYTEVRMARLAGELLADIDKRTVDFGPNYDESLQEPLVMPTRVPNLLVNGSAGIAVGMATNIPPHNLGEVVDGCIAMMRSPDITIPELMTLIPAPDFPTGGIIYGTSGLRQAYETGRGIIRVRGRAEVETLKNDRERIIITEIPYQVNKASLLEKVAGLVRDKRLEGISDIRDESDRDGMRVVIDIKRDGNGEVVLNQLYTMTQLQSSFGINTLAIVSGRPCTLSLRDILRHFLDHRREVVTRRTRFELAEAERRFNLVFGLLAAIDSIDRIIDIIRGAADQASAKEQLLREQLPLSPAFKAFCEKLLTVDYAPGRTALEQGHVMLNEDQSQAILDMRLARLTGLERDKLNSEAESLRDRIHELQAILHSDERLREVIIQELEAVKEGYADPRRTSLEHDARDMSDEDLIAEEEMVVTVSHAGYVKRHSIDLYRAQRRGGRGKTGATTREEDFVADLFVASTHSYVLIFTDRGKVYWLKVHRIPETGRQSRGKPIVNLINVEPGESIAAVLPVREFVEGEFLVMATAKGYIKKTDIMSFSHPRSNGLIALSIDEGDRLIGVRRTDGERTIFIGTKMGMAIHFSEDQVRPMGRTARGVRSVSLRKSGDEVVGMVVAHEDFTEVLTVTSDGLAKRSSFDEYRVQGRGGSGMINARLRKEATVAAVTGVCADDELMVVTNRGMLIRTEVAQIPVVGRATQGVRLMTLQDGESVSSVARIAERDDEASEGADEESGDTDGETTDTE